LTSVSDAHQAPALVWLFIVTPWSEEHRIGSGVAVCANAGEG
jgi:hypothetical protein